MILGIIVGEASAMLLVNGFIGFGINGLAHYKTCLSSCVHKFHKLEWRCVPNLEDFF